MENVLQLNSDKLKREIRLKIQLYEKMLQSNIDKGNVHDLVEYIRILFYDTLPLSEKFKRLKNTKTSANQTKMYGGDNGNTNEDENENENGNIEGEEEREEEYEDDITDSPEVLMEKEQKNISNEEKSKLMSLYKDPEGEFERYFESLFSYIENNENQLPAIREKYQVIIKTKFTEIQEKLKKCDQQIQFLESLYIQSELQQKIPLTGMEKISFILKDQGLFGETNYGPSELFSRYIFTLLIYPNGKNGDDVKSLPENFYQNDIFQNITQSFSNWNPLLQFWFIYVLMVQQLFAKDANIEEFIREKSLFELAKKVRSLKSKEDKGKKGKKGKKEKKKHQRGGSDEQKMKKLPLLNSVIKSNKNRNKSKKKNNESNRYKELMKKMIIRKKNNIQNFYQFFNSESFKQKVKEFYDDKIGKHINCETSLPYFSDPTEFFQVKTLINCGKKNRSYNGNISLKLKERIDKEINIFQTLYGYVENNSEIFQSFLTRLNREILFFYFVIYYKKKFIYMRYLEIFKNILRQKGMNYSSWETSEKKNQNESNLQNKTNSPNQPKKENNQSSLTNEKPNHSPNLPPNKLSQLKNIESKIRVLEEKRKVLEQNRNQPNYDKKILLIEKYIHELILEKRKIF